MTLRRALRKLRLKEGDILVVRDSELLRRLETMQSPFAFKVRLVYEPRKGDLRKVAR